MTKIYLFNVFICSSSIISNDLKEKSSASVSGQLHYRIIFFLQLVQSLFYDLLCFKHLPKKVLLHNLDQVRTLDKDFGLAFSFYIGICPIYLFFLNFILVLVTVLSWGDKVETVTQSKEYINLACFIILLWPEGNTSSPIRYLFSSILLDDFSYIYIGFNIFLILFSYIYIGSNIFLIIMSTIHILS